MSEYTRYLHETLNPCETLCQNNEPKIYKHRKQNINMNMNYTTYVNRQNKKSNIDIMSSSQLNSHQKSSVPFCNTNGTICKTWHNHSDQPVPSGTHFHSNTGVDIKHNSYDRFMRRLKGGTLTKNNLTIS